MCRTGILMFFSTIQSVCLTQLIQIKHSTAMYVCMYVYMYVCMYVLHHDFGILAKLQVKQSFSHLFTVSICFEVIIIS